MDEVRITRSLAIPERELEVSFARSGGPGGQHVNTSSTKVELRFDVAGSPSLTEAQKARIRAHLGSRVTGDGVLILTASEHRSQTRNRDAVMARFRRLLAEALRERKRRKPTRPSRAARERRLADKRRRSEKKAHRQDPDIADA
jgi:ribosome-associated protein